MKPLPRRPPGARACRRKGAIAMVAMISLLVASMIGVMLVKMALAHARQMQREQLSLQCGWLVQSGLDRAAAHLADKPDYAGETWNIAAEELTGQGPARVQITVEPVGTESNSRLVTVVAEYPMQTTHRARLSRRYLVNIPTTGTTNSNPARTGASPP